MTEDRVYRATPGHDKALLELTRLAGKQFDPVVVDSFIRLLEERPDLAEIPVQACDPAEERVEAQVD
jgi:HD-GYP domain-containing protein (c-di-GMP phosphodiesterase class II)